jgi:hypothetical protein
LLTLAALQQTPVLILSHPHREHFAAFVCQSGLLITPGRAKSFPGRRGVGQAAGASVAFSGFRGAALNQSRSASGVYTGLMVNRSGNSGKCFMWRGKMRMRCVSAECHDGEMTPPRSLGRCAPAVRLRRALQAHECEIKTALKSERAKKGCVVAVFP